MAITDQQRDELHNDLLMKKSEVIEAIKHLEQELQSGDDVRSLSDDADVSQHYEQRTNMLAELKRSQNVLRSVNSSLENFDDDFSYCVACGVDIPYARLKFNPAVKTCVSCQTTIEFKQRTTHA